MGHPAWQARPAARPCCQQPQGGTTAVTRLVCYFGGGSRQSEPARPRKEK
jgi:hypothetical protein